VPDVFASAFLGRIELDRQHWLSSTCWATTLGSQAFRVPVIAVFFSEGDGITNESIYFDAASLLARIGRRELLALAGASE
jgi:hypothetical protein